MAKEKGKEWEGYGPKDPDNPTNKPGYSQLPSGVLCANCEAFKGLVCIKTDQGVQVMSVKCQPPLMDKRVNQIAVDPLFKNSGSMLTGLCVLINNGYDFGGWPAVSDSEYQTNLDFVVRLLAIKKSAPTETK